MVLVRSLDGPEEGVNRKGSKVIFVLVVLELVSTLSEARDLLGEDAIPADRAGLTIVPRSSRRPMQTPCRPARKLDRAIAQS